MLRATKVHRTGVWPEVLEHGVITLPYAERQRRRMRMQDDAGNIFLLDLDHAMELRDGDGLELDSGGFVRVRAAAEPVLVIECAEPEQAARIAWHIGNRHVPMQVLGASAFCIQRDHVLAEMLTGLGARVREALQPFSPESGAYSHHAH